MSMFAGNKEVKIWLHDVTVAVRTGFPAHEIGDILRHVRLHRGQLLAAWDEHFRA
jgi:hypothetical protein